jgi:hypothetical protein
MLYAIAMASTKIATGARWDLELPRSTQLWSLFVLAASGMLALETIVNAGALSHSGEPQWKDYNGSKLVLAQLHEITFLQTIYVGKA